MKGPPRIVLSTIPREHKLRLDRIKWDSKRILELSMDYIDDMTEALIKWSKRSDSTIIPQFCAMHGVGMSQLSFFMTACPELREAYEVAIARLAVKWHQYIANNPEMTPVQQRLAFKYLRMYDRQEKYQEMLEKVDMSAFERKALANTTPYAIEDYSKAPLEE